MILNNIIEKFRLSETERENLIKHADVTREAIPNSFKEIAQAILSGHFEVAQGATVIRKVYPTIVEIYYHEEDIQEENLKDYIVYHRNKPNADKLSLFEKGSLNAHQSGIDITFEHYGIKNNTVRASALIRGFKIGKEGKEDTRCTYLYEALFTDVSMINSGYSLRWVDDEEVPMEQIDVDKRVNVKQYHHKNESGEEKYRPAQTDGEAIKDDKAPDTRLRKFFVKKKDNQ